MSFNFSEPKNWIKRVSDSQNHSIIVNSTVEESESAYPQNALLDQDTDHYDSSSIGQ